MRTSGWWVIAGVLAAGPALAQEEPEPESERRAQPVEQDDATRDDPAAGAVDVSPTPGEPWRGDEPEHPAQSNDYPRPGPLDPLSPGAFD